MKTHNFLVILGYLAIIFKVMFILFALAYRMLQKKYNSTKLLIWKKRTDVLYITCMSIFLIFFFNPWDKNKRYMTKTIFNLLFIYGIISIITADWASFK